VGVGVILYVCITPPTQQRGLIGYIINPLPAPSHPSQALLKSKLRGESCSAPPQLGSRKKAKTGTGF